MAGNTIEDYTTNNSYFHKASGSYFTMIARGGRHYQRRHQIGFGGKETSVMEKEIHFVMGSGNHVDKLGNASADPSGPSEMRERSPPATHEAGFALKRSTPNRDSRKRRSESGVGT